MKSIAPLLSCLAFAGFVAAAEAAPQYAFSPDGNQPRQSAATAVIADGTTVMPITIEPDAPVELKSAAHEIARTLEEMTGQSFSIEESTEPRGIVIGTFKVFPNKEAAEALAKKAGTLKEIDGFPVPESDEPGLGKWKAVEAFAIRTDKDAVYLLGWTDKGAVHAASRFLELLGVRRYTPSPVWKITPQATVVRFDAEEEQAPSYPFRDLWFDYGNNVMPEVEKDEFNNLQKWQFATKIGTAFPIRSNHMYQRAYYLFKEEFDNNKDKYYAEIKGERKLPGKYCLSQPRVREMLVETALKGFENKEGERVNFATSAEPSDGGYWCECEQCKAMGSTAERASIIANEIAKAAEAKYPGDNMVGRLAYFYHSNPPSFKLEPNITISVATRMIDGSDWPLNALLKEWPKHHANLGVYDYFSNALWGQERIRPVNSYMPAASPLGIAKLLREYYNLGYRSMIAESTANFAIFGLGYWVAAHVMWNQNADEQALLNDFYEKAFGPAKEPMRKFYELLSPDSGRLDYVNTFAQLQVYLEEAAKAAEKDQGVLERINDMKLFMISNYYQHRGMDYDTDNTEAKALWTGKQLGFVYRIRDKWITHYAAWLDWSNRLAKRYEKPEWAKMQLWKEEDKGTITQEELDVLWKEVREYSKPIPIGNVAYASGVKIVENPDAVGEPQTTFALVGPGYFISADGAPLKLKVSLPDQRKPHSTITLKDENENVVFEKMLDAKPEGLEAREELELEIPLPAPGVYHTEWGGFAAAQVTIEESTPFFIKKAQDTVNFGSNLKRYFYIPKNIDTVYGYALKIGDKFKFFTKYDEGMEVEVPEGHIFKLEIPESLRGSVWYVNASGREGFTFLNIPSLFFINPWQMILPDNVDVN